MNDNGRDEAISSRSIREALVEASSFLAEQGVGDGRTDAELLMQHMLGWDRSRLLLEWNELFPGKYAEEWSELLSRRGAGEPVQYMLGEQEFYGLPFEVNPAVLIPRPETELLVEAIMKRGREIWATGVGREEGRVEGRAESRAEYVENSMDKPDRSEKPDRSDGQGPLVVDIGTGSGAIAVSLAAFNPSWQLVACDLSPRAIEVASRNVEKNGVGDRVTFYQGDLLEPVIKLGLRADILVSNPPYIPSTDIPGLQREVREHEPMLALDGGEDGLYCYRTMLEQMQRLPMVPRLVGFEVGFGQARDVAALMEKCGWWQQVDIIRDYAGIERHVIGWNLESLR
jgi:release factor glutamine methyltransferase